MSLKNFFTGKDNSTFDVGRLLWFEAVNGYIILSAFWIWKNGNFDPVTWATGLSGLLASGAASLYLKKETEPSVPESTTTVISSTPTSTSATEVKK